jgi:hypothetical protein
MKLYCCNVLLLGGLTVWGAFKFPWVVPGFAALTATRVLILLIARRKISLSTPPRYSLPTCRSATWGRLPRFPPRGHPNDLAILDSVRGRRGGVRPDHHLGTTILASQAECQRDLVGRPSRRALGWAMAPYLWYSRRSLSAVERPATGSNGKRRTPRHPSDRDRVLPRSLPPT